MDKNITINVARKVATLMGTPVIVCGNSDYTITFNFDEEWGSLTGEFRTARFVYYKLGERQHEDVVFSGDTVQVPVLAGVAFVEVGVYTGNLSTTTPARILCTPSILCSTGSIENPTQDVYNQLLATLNELVAQGAFGANEEQVAQIEANTQNIEANTQNIEANTQNIEEILDGTQQVGDSAKLGGKGASEYAEANKVYGENILINPDFKINQREKTNYVNPNGTDSLMYTVDRWWTGGSGEITITPKQNSGVSITTNTVTSFGQFVENYIAYIGKTLTLSAKVSNVVGVFDMYLYFGGGATYSKVTISHDGIFEVKHTVENTANGIRVYFDSHSNNSSIDIEWVKLEVGETATPFLPPEPATEMMKCLRYYWKPTDGYVSGIATAQYDDGIELICQPPVPMRVIPTLKYSTLENIIRLIGSNDITPTSLRVGWSSVSHIGIDVNYNNGFIIGRSYALQTNRSQTDANIEFDAEIY